MGVKVVYMVVGFIGLSAGSMLTGLMLPQHSLSFFSLYGIKVARIWTYMSSVQTVSSGNDFCRALKTIVSSENLNWCSGLDGMTDIQDVQQRFCAPAFAHIWPGFCEGLQSAYGVGMAVNLVVFVNLCLQATAAWLILDYGNRKANPKHRKASMISLCCGLALLSMVLLYYGFSVLTNLSSVSSASGVSSVFSAVLSASKGIGMSHGYVALWMGASFQFCAIALFNEAKMGKKEERYREGKALKEYDSERAADGYDTEAVSAARGGPQLRSSPAPGQQQGFAPQPGIGMQQQGFGMQPQGFAMQQPGFAAAPQQGFRQQGDFGLA